jgi:hypothetical protein
LKLILRLVQKDFLRFLKRPWGVLIIICIPVLMAALMGFAFGGRSGDMEENIIIQVAVMDEDDDFIAGLLRSISSQGDASQNLIVHYVDTREAGFQMLEDRKASSFIVFPKLLTSNVLNSVTSTIQVYRNPAESILPKIVETGVDLGAVFISEGLEFIGPEIKLFREWVENKDRMNNWDIAMVFFSALEKMKNARDYVDPPIIQFNSIKAADYIQSASRENQPGEPS